VDTDNKDYTIPASREIPTFPGTGTEDGPTYDPSLDDHASTGDGTKTIYLRGDIPPEIWNRLGIKILPKLKAGMDLKIGIDFSVTINRQFEKNFEADLKQILEDLGLTGKVNLG